MRLRNSHKAPACIIFLEEFPIFEEENLCLIWFSEYPPYY